MMTDEVYFRAEQLVPDLEERHRALLEVLCSVAVTALEARLKTGLRVEDCQEAFLTAASLFALADLNAVLENMQVEEFKAGDLTIKPGTGGNPEAVCRTLQKQAERLMAPYLKDQFCFAGV